MATTATTGTAICSLSGSSLASTNASLQQRWGWRSFGSRRIWRCGPGFQSLPAVLWPRQVGRQVVLVRFPRLADSNELAYADQYFRSQRREYQRKQ